VFEKLEAPVQGFLEDRELGCVRVEAEVSRSRSVLFSCLFLLYLGFLDFDQLLLRANLGLWSSDIESNISVSSVSQEEDGSIASRRPRSSS